MAYSLLTSPEPRVTHSRNFIVLTEKRAVRNHPVSLQRYLQYMEDNHDAWPTVYPQQNYEFHQRRRCPWAKKTETTYTIVPESPPPVGKYGSLSIASIKASDLISAIAEFRQNYP